MINNNKEEPGPDDAAYRASQEMSGRASRALMASLAEPLTDEEREQYTTWMWRNPNTAREAGTQRLFLHIAVIEQALTLARQRAAAAEQDAEKWKLLAKTLGAAALRASEP